jgi:hypothetical protein
MLGYSAYCVYLSFDIRSICILITRLLPPFHQHCESSLLLTAIHVFDRILLPKLALLKLKMNSVIDFLAVVDCVATSAVHKK